MGLDPLEKEYKKAKERISKEIVLLFEANMKIFDWDIPENDDREAARLIITAMEEAIGKLKEDVEAGKYDDY